MASFLAIVDYVVLLVCGDIIIKYNCIRKITKRFQYVFQYEWMDLNNLLLNIKYLLLKMAVDEIMVVSNQRKEGRG